MRFNGYTGDTVVKTLPAPPPQKKNVPASAGNTGDAGSMPWLGGSLGVGNGNPLQYSCLENSMDRGAWWATVHGATNSQTQLSD